MENRPFRPAALFFALLVIVSLPLSVLAQTDSSLAVPAQPPPLASDTAGAQTSMLEDLVTDDGEQLLTYDRRWLTGSLIFLVIVVLCVFYYMVSLQKQFLRAVREDKQLTAFMDKPAGLPSGTIRSILTLLLVIFSLYLFILDAFGVMREFPEALAAILSAIIGFYFGSRSSSGPDEGESERVLRDQLSTATDAKDETRAEQFVKKVGKNISMVKTAMNYLPDGIREKYTPLLEKLEKGSAVARDLMDDASFGKAAEKAEGAYQTFIDENPFREAVDRAERSFSRVVPGISAFALMDGLVGVTAALAGVRYNRWKARVLDLPFSPSVAPINNISPVDGRKFIAETGVFPEALGDRLSPDPADAFMNQLLNDILILETPVLWDNYRIAGAFTDYGSFAESVQEVRMKVATSILRVEIQGDLLQECGGYDAFMAAIDTIRADGEAGGDLDLLMELSEGLKLDGEPIHSIYQKVRKVEEQPL